MNVGRVNGSPWRDSNPIETHAHRLIGDQLQIATVDVHHASRFLGIIEGSRDPHLEFCSGEFLRGDGHERCVTQGFYIADFVHEIIVPQEVGIWSVGEGAVTVVDQVSVGGDVTRGTGRIGRSRVQVAVQVGVVGGYVDEDRRVDDRDDTVGIGLGWHIDHERQTHFVHFAVVLVRIGAVVHSPLGDIDIPCTGLLAPRRIGQASGLDRVRGRDINHLHQRPCSGELSHHIGGLANDKESSVVGVEGNAFGIVYSQAPSVETCH